jgi:putative nucleotidyltransferase-like protein
MGKDYRSLSMAAVAEIRPVPSGPAGSPTARAFGDNREFELLLACCECTSRAERVRALLSHGLNWERLLALVDHHRVVPQIYGELSAYPHLVPAELLDTLRARYRDNARKTLWFRAELVRIVSHLESAEIKAVPYKGPVLAQALYGAVTQRQFGDLDILILPADVPKAKAALRDLGYKPALELAPQIEATYIETGYEYSFGSTHGQNLLELQWRIVPRFYSIDFDVAELFDRAGEITFGERPVRSLCAEDLLLVLSVHAAKHVWVQLSWLCDIAQLAKSRQLDWNAIQREACRLGIERIVNLNLFLAHKLLGSPLLPAIEMRVREDPSTTVLADEILTIIENSTHYNTESISYFRLMMRLRERWQDRARFLWRLAITPSLSEWSIVRLPKHLQPLYRLVRLSRLAKRLACSE